jgi:uncharacterized membrane protein YhhN
MPTISNINGRTYWPLALYILLLLADIGILMADWDSARLLSKSLLMPALLLFFFLNTNKPLTQLQYILIAALICSWLGDLLLLWEASDPLFFITGLSAFLLAHIFYCICFEKMRRVTGTFIWWPGIPLLVYFAALILLLTPYLDALAWPVRIYGFCITLMGFLAWQLKLAWKSNEGNLLLWGAGLFILSDSLLAINKFYQSFALAGPLVMLTYGLAQLLIVMALLRRWKGIN